MSRLLLSCCGLIVLVSVSVVGQSSSSTTPTRASYDIDFIGPPLADPVMQQAKETYVVFGCAYCHGVTLTPRGEATDLTRSALVGSDTNGDRIVALLRAGIPQTAKLSPMPQFSDLSDRQLHDIAQVHPLRAPGKPIQAACRREPRDWRRRRGEGALRSAVHVLPRRWLGRHRSEIRRADAA